MAFDWKDYLDLAQFLFDQSDSLAREAALRSATSRAYYAAYRFVRNYASTNMGFISSKSAAVHGELIGYLGRNGKTNIAHKLEQMRIWRNRCDYDDEVFQLTRITIDTLDGANKVFNGLK